MFVRQIAMAQNQHSRISTPLQAENKVPDFEDYASQIDDGWKPDNSPIVRSNY